MRSKALLSVSKHNVRLLVQDEQQGDVLKARLPLSSPHPRALLTLLEGMALWQQHALSTVIIADQRYPHWLGSGLFGDELSPGESPLVHFSVEARGCGKRLGGLGEFRQLYGRRGYR